MAPKTACIIRPGPTVCPGQIAFTLRIPGGGTPLRFTRGTVDQRRAMLDPGQIAALEAAGYEVVNEVPQVPQVPEVPDAPAATAAPRARRKAGKAPAEA